MPVFLTVLAIYMYAAKNNRLFRTQFSGFTSVFIQLSNPVPKRVPNSRFSKSPRHLENLLLGT